MDENADVLLPDLALDRVDVTRFKLIHLMVMAVAEAGRPMTYEAIRVRLERRGIHTSVLSLQRAWHGRPQLRKDASGALELERESDLLGWKVLVHDVRDQLGLLPSPAPKPAPPPPDGRTPLTWEELARAFSASPLPRLTAGQLLGALLEGIGHPAGAEEVKARGQELGRSWLGSLQSCACHRASPVLRVGDDLWAADTDHVRMAEARAEIRLTLRRWEKAEEQRRGCRESAERRRREEAQQAARWATARRCFLRTFWHRGQLVAASLLDPDSLEIASVANEDELRARLSEVQIILALGPPKELAMLDLTVASYDLVDLRTSIRTRRLNKAGRTLKVTPGLLIGSTLGKGWSLGNSRQLATWVGQGQLGKIRQRLASEAKTLYAFHAYGALHGFVRLRWGFLDEEVPVRWRLPGQPGLAERLRAAANRGRAVDVVLWGPPGWADPWSRALRCEPAGTSWWRAKLRRLDDGQELDVPLADIYAVKEADQNEGLSSQDSGTTMAGGGSPAFLGGPGLQPPCHRHPR
jgi:hypothetical protein